MSTAQLQCTGLAPEGAHVTGPGSPAPLCNYLPSGVPVLSLTWYIVFKLWTQLAEGQALLHSGQALLNSPGQALSDISQGLRQLM